MREWNINKDNVVQANPYEWKRLKARRHLTDKTLHVECPNYKEIDQRSARHIAELAHGSAVIGGCGKILVKGPRWQYEFDTKSLNGEGKWWGQRSGMIQNPLELQRAGCSFDESKKLWQVS